MEYDAEDSSVILKFVYKTVDKSNYLSCKSKPVNGFEPSTYCPPKTSSLLLVQDLSGFKPQAFAFAFEFLFGTH